MTVGPTLSDKMKHACWRPASGHPSGRWRVVRQFIPPLKPAPGAPAFQTATGKTGRVRLFKTYGAAHRAAIALEHAEPYDNGRFRESHKDSES